MNAAKPGSLALQSLYHYHAARALGVLGPQGDLADGVKTDGAAGLR